jgi:chemotaxis protein MotA
MDIATIIGVVTGIGLILGSIALGGSLTAFVNIPGLAVVVGGTLAATLIMQRLSVVLGAFRVGIKVIKSGYTPPDEIIKVISRLADASRKDGVLALEKINVSNEFINKGKQMMVDGVDEKEIAMVLKTELVYMKQRHKRGQKVFKFMASTSPAMGMVGTLIGLVQMLMTLSDPAAIGPAMAVALLTTFYGAVLAFLFFGPMAAKLESRTQEQSALLEMIISGLSGIMNQEHPRIIEQRLVSFLDPGLRKSASGNAGKGKAKKAA